MSDKSFIVSAYSSGPGKVTLQMSEMTSYGEIYRKELSLHELMRLLDELNAAVRFQLANVTCEKSS